MSSFNSHHQNQRHLPSWLTNETEAVDTLLAEIARQAPTAIACSPEDMEAAKKKARIRLDEAMRGIDNGDDDDGNEEGYNADQQKQDNTALVADSAIEPISKLIRSETILRKFLHKFVIARAGRYESAAQRVLNLCKFLEQYPHLSITYDLDIIKALNVNCVEAFPFKQCDRHSGAILIYMKLSLLDWDKIEVEQFEKMFFWLFFAVIMMPNHTTQRNGVVLQICGEDLSPSHIKLSFQLFCLRLMSQCLPIRVMGVYCYNFPRFVRWVVYPPLKLAIPNKIIDRILFTEDAEEIEKKVGAGDLHHRFAGGHWRSNPIPSAGDLALITQWTQDGKVFLPSDVSNRIDILEKGKDARDEADGYVLSGKRRFY